MENYKQKYEQALEIARDFIERQNPPALDRNIMSKIFPELRESEDERIRKAIRIYLDWLDGRKDYAPKGGHSIKDMLSWLEKQGELVNSLSKGLDKAHERIDGLIQKNNSLIEQLEKQGEQKTVDKVEPKFKVGDWFTNGACIIKITSVDDRYYWHDNDCVGGDIESINKEYHPWTIQDAKDGDVLAVNNEVFIYAHRKQLYSIAVAHCFVDSAGGFYLDGEFGYMENGNLISLATKEQRDTLFARMKEEGYEWNSEKKELKKIEQKPDFCHHEVDLSDCSEEYRKAYYDGWNNCNMQHARLEAERKPAWSEEDEEMFDAIIADIQFTQKAHNHEVNQIVYEREIDWLKSLKERMKGE